MLFAICYPVLAGAQAQDSSRTVEFRFTPTVRTQIALWIEKADGTFVKTVGLTQAVSFRGIGNRPGAAQMNGGFHWPYGRREGVLPIWAHRRAVAPGAAQFKRVIFQNRDSEGDASRTSADSTPESYFCLSFNTATTQRNALDAVTCASAFSSDKGRYLLPSDIDAQYSEPAVLGGQPTMRPLDLISLYPPRRDVKSCHDTGCSDTADVAAFAGDAVQVMPDIDAVTMATPPRDMEQAILFTVPDDWADGDYVAWIEVSKEGDYNATFSDQTYPTPTQPANKWDIWAMTYGYPYRGQPSVAFKLPFTLGGSPPPFKTVEPSYYGDVDGFGPSGGDMHPFVAGIIADNPNDSATVGSGADRLRLTDSHDYRFEVTVRGRDVCASDVPPEAPGDVVAYPYPESKHSHQWGHMHFVAPAGHTSPIAQYEVKVSTDPISRDNPGSFTQAMPAYSIAMENEALMVPTADAAGASVEVDFGGLLPLTHYYVAIRARDVCTTGPYAVAELTTTKINFTQLSGCFIATAAYGSAMEPHVASLRAIRDTLRPRSALFATATDLYYRSGPAAAAVIARSEVARAVVRTLLGPVVDAARAATPLLAVRPQGQAQGRDKARDGRPLEGRESETLRSQAHEMTGHFSR